MTWQAALQAQLEWVGRDGWSPVGSGSLQPGQGELHGIPAVPLIPWARLALPSTPGGAASPQRCCPQGSSTVTGLLEDLGWHLEQCGVGAQLLGTGAAVNL